MKDHRNTILAVILSGMVLISWQYFFVVPQMEKQQAAQKAQQAQQAQQATQPQAPGTPQPGTATPAQRLKPARCALRWAARPSFRPLS